MTPGSHANQKRAERVARALANPIYFGELYVRPFDQNWTDALPRFASEMLAFCMTTRRGVVILPPEFLKTTLISQVWPLWLTFKWTMTGKVLRGMLLSEEEGMAVQNLTVQKWHIEHNDILKADFSDRHGKPLIRPDETEQRWTEDAIIVARPGTSKDPTWQAKGLNSTGVQGRRLDILIGDDVITPANAFSPAHRERAVRGWDMQFTTRIVKDGRAIVAGNFNDPHDLVSTLSRRSEYKLFRRTSFHAPGRPDIGMDPSRPESVALWPQNWPKERGLQEKREKPDRFARIHLLTAISETGSALKSDWITFIGPEDTPLPYCSFVLSVDAAPGGETDDLDFFTLTVGAVHGNHVDVIESYAMRGSTNEQVDTVALFHDRYQRVGKGVIAIGGAKIALDRYFTGAVLIKRPDLEGKLQGVSIPGEKVDRLKALGPYFKTNYLRISRDIWETLTSDVQDRHQEMSMRDEVVEFPNGRHDDRLDGLDVLVRTVREHALEEQEIELEAQHAA